MEIKDLVFNHIKKLCDFLGCDYGKTEGFFTVGRITSIYTLKNMLDYLEMQHDYEVFIETERIDGEIYYFISGEKINDKKD